MSETAVVDPVVTFTKNDIAPTAGDGKYMTEEALASVLEIIGDFVQSGLAVPTGASLTQQITTGVAFIKGFRVTTTATNLTFGASAVSYVHLSLTVDGGGLVDGVLFEIETSGTPTYTKALTLCRVTTSGSAVTTVEQIAPSFSGAITGNELNALTAMGLF